jgi:hypothetical protein
MQNLQPGSRPSSCRQLIRVGSSVLRTVRFRPPLHDISCTSSRFHKSTDRCARSSAHFAGRGWARHARGRVHTLDRGRAVSAHSIGIWAWAERSPGACRDEPPLVGEKRPRSAMIAGRRPWLNPGASTWQRGSKAVSISKTSTRAKKRIESARPTGGVSVCSPTDFRDAGMGLSAPARCAAGLSGRSGGCSLSMVASRGTQFPIPIRSHGEPPCKVKPTRNP